MDLLYFFVVAPVSVFSFLIFLKLLQGFFTSLSYLMTCKDKYLHKKKRFTDKELENIKFKLSENISHGLAAIVWFSMYINSSITSNSSSFTAYFFNTSIIFAGIVSVVVSFIIFFVVSLFKLDIIFLKIIDRKKSKK